MKNSDGVGAASLQREPDCVLGQCGAPLARLKPPLCLMVFTCEFDADTVGWPGFQAGNMAPWDAGSRMIRSSVDENSSSCDEGE